VLILNQMPRQMMVQVNVESARHGRGSFPEGVWPVLPAGGLSVQGAINVIVMPSVLRTVSTLPIWHYEAKTCPGSHGEFLLSHALPFAGSANHLADLFWSVFHGCPLNVTER
jgi:hypothetical protein